MKRLLASVLAGLALTAAGAALDAGAAPTQDKKADNKEWVQLFNGKDLSGWKSHPQSPGTWEVKDGAIVGSDVKASHLFTDRGDYQNFHYRLEAKISDKGNSGQYFRATFAPGYPPGYEAQINSTHSDSIRTGSLYPAFNPKLTKEQREKIIVKEQLVKPDEWFTQEVIADGNHLQIFVNGKKTVDFVDETNAFTKGHLAIQGHDAFKDKEGKVYPTIIQVRKAEVKELPATPAK